MKLSTYERLRRRVPGPLWRGAERLAVGCVGTRDRVLGTGGKLVPPARLRHKVGHLSARRFAQSGDDLVAALVSRAGLGPSSHVLEVGCGCGRVALPLRGILSGSGSYSGFDVDEEMVRWCAATFRDSPAFRFVALDVYNQRYNPRGKVRPSQLRFPYDDESADLVCLHSVLTHLLPPELETYLSEVRRVLRPGGTAWITYFLQNPQVESWRASHPDDFPFPDTWEGHPVRRRDLPEAGIAYGESFVEQVYARLGLVAREKLYGSWAGRTPTLPAPDVNFQDVVLTVRRGS